MSDYEKLEGLCKEIDALIAQNVTASSPEFQAWKVKSERFLIQKYGKNSFEHERLMKQNFSLRIYSFNTPHSDFVDACRDGLVATKKIFETYLPEMKEEPVAISQNAIVNPDFSKVFIVHGHDEGLKQAVARLVEHQGIRAIILNEQTNQGLTIIEKVEKYSDINAAVCLFTPDDVGRSIKENNAKDRARQNVILETGYFIGKLGRSKVIIIASDDLEIPSDLQGIVYTNSTNWQFSVLQELKAIGYKIDYNKLDLQA